MKFSSVVVATLLANQASAFTPPFSGVQRSALASSFVADAPVAVSDVEEATAEAVSKSLEETPVVTSDRIQLGRYADLEKSIALPFMKRPRALDGTHPGDHGFDPLGFTRDNDLYTMMESETRHGRLAMLAVVGWPAAELLGPKWLLQGENDLAPSVLNGFNPLTLISTVAIFGALGFFEYKTALRSNENTKLGKIHKEDMAGIWNYGVPGDYNFDPLNFYSLIGNDAKSRKGLRDVEVSHGRMAMLGITYFAMWEYLTGHPIVENNPLFHPNLLVPFLTIAYFSFGFFYEVKNTDEVLFQIETTTEGVGRIERIKTAMANSADANAKNIEMLGNASGAIVDGLGTVSEAAINGAKGLKEKYDNLNDSYTSNVLSNTK